MNNILSVSERVFWLLNKRKRNSTIPQLKSNLYKDLGFDSLSFVCLLIEIEKFYSIKFELIEMGKCIYVANLIALIEKKVNVAKS